MRAFGALRPAASISWPSSLTSLSRAAKPSVTGVASGVSRYMSSIILLWRGSTPARPAKRGAAFATCASPRKTSGIWLVKEMALLGSSKATSRFMKPER